MRGRVIYHLKRRAEEGSEEKARERREEVAGSSLHHSRCLLFCHCQPHGDWPLSGLHFSLATAALPHKLFPPSTGPPETFVPFISTTNTYRCSGKEDAERERISKHMPPSYPPPQMTADLETICFFVNKRHAEELMREVVLLFNVNVDS